VAHFCLALRVTYLKRSPVDYAEQTEVEMKANLFRVTALLAVVLAFSAVSAYGQSVVQRERFVVPFNFSVGQKVLPAGEYTFSTEKSIVRIQSRDGKQNLIAMPYRTRIASQSHANTRLTFKRYGDSYVLAQVWLADGLGRELKRQQPAGSEVSTNITTVELNGRGR